jgi:uncharacterized protein (TIGR03435 family)
VSHRALPVLVVLVAASAILAAQSPAPSSTPLQFEVASIKRNITGTLGGGVRASPSGQITVTGAPVSYLLSRALLAPGIARIEGMPSWAYAERYDFVVKAPAGTPGAEQQQMWRTLAIDRLRLASHIEMREEPTYDLVIARRDGRLGPQIKRSALDCAKVDPLVPQSNPAGATRDEIRDAVLNRCNAFWTDGDTARSGGASMEALIGFIRGPAGRVIVDRTGLTGSYAIELTFARMPAADTPDGPPSLFTAVEEQLGLKLVASKSPLKVVVIDHLERPVEN